MNKKLAAILCTSLAWQAFPAMAATGLEGVSLSGFLTAGATYAFQVRALGKLGYTAWSDSANRMSM